MNNQEIKQLLDQILARLQNLETAVSARNENQIKYPVDELSRAALLQAFPSATKVGTGTYGTQVATVSGGTVTVPAQPSGTVKVSLAGVVYEFVVK